MSRTQQLYNTASSIALDIRSYWCDGIIYRLDALLQLYTLLKNTENRNDISYDGRYIRSSGIVPYGHNMKYEEYITLDADIQSVIRNCLQ